MTSVSDPLLGAVLDGRYQITTRLARGGMATVYAAVDTRLTRTVAVKVMHAGLGDDAEFARKFDREARAAARLSHPNVVSVFDQGVDAGRPYIVMEYVEGQTLRDVIARQTPMAPLRALEIMESVLAALAAAHDAGLVHRDVKPENVLIAERGQIKVADFGLAKAISAQTSTATQGLLIGTVSYLPPELVVSGHADARSDVYSAGVVLFELLTGRKPHVGDTPIQVAYAHVHADVPPPSSLPTAGPIPDYLDALLAAFTARDPQARPHDGRVMLSQLRRVQAALRDGVRADTELTTDLTVPLRAVPGAAEPTPTLQRDVDREPTTFVAPVTEAPASPSSPAATTWAPPAAPPEPARTSLPQRRSEEFAVRQRTRRIRGLIVLILVLLLTAVVTLGAWYLAAGRFTSAPALAGLDQQQASRVAADAGIGVRFDEAWSESVPVGTVISADPGAGAKMLADGQVAAVISKGPERYAVPTLVGLSQTAAVAALGASHLTVGAIAQSWSDTVASGTVIDSSRTAGARIKPDTTVDLTVSKGPKPITITSYVGKDAAKAEKALTKAGFEVKTSTSNSDSVAKGDVISQAPKSGTGKKGDVITLERSLGPVMVVVPNVKGMGLSAARSTLEAAGFKVATRHASIYLGLQYVASSSVAGGNKAPKGSTITLSLV